jgi:hypothetical protein
MKVSSALILAAALVLGSANTSEASKTDKKKIKTVDINPIPVFGRFSGRRNKDELKGELEVKPRKAAPKRDELKSVLKKSTSDTNIHQPSFPTREEKSSGDSLRTIALSHEDNRHTGSIKAATIQKKSTGSSCQVQEQSTQKATISQVSAVKEKESGEDEASIEETEGNSFEASLPTPATNVSSSNSSKTVKVTGTQQKSGSNVIPSSVQLQVPGDQDEHEKKDDKEEVKVGNDGEEEGNEENEDEKENDDEDKEENGGNDDEENQDHDVVKEGESEENEEENGKEDDEQEEEEEDDDDEDEEDEQEDEEDEDEQGEEDEQEDEEENLEEEEETNIEDETLIDVDSDDEALENTDASKNSNAPVSANMSMSTSMYRLANASATETNGPANSAPENVVAPVVTNAIKGNKVVAASAPKGMDASQSSSAAKDTKVSQTSNATKDTKGSKSYYSSNTYPRRDGGGSTWKTYSGSTSTLQPKNKK